MSVRRRKLAGGWRWAFDKTVRGQRLWSPYVYLTRMEAERGEADVVAAFLTGRLPQTSEPISVGTETVGQLYTRWLDWLAGHRSPGHAAKMRSLMSRALAQAPQHVDLPAANLTADQVEAWAESWAKDLHSRGKGRATINDWLRYSQAAWNPPWGRRRAPREYPNNPFAQVERYRVSRQAKYVPTPAEVQALRLAATGGFALWLEIVLNTGARPSEALNLAWADVNCDVEPWSVVLHTSKTAHGDRMPSRLLIPPELAKRLRSWRRLHSGEVYVFQQTEAEAPHHLIWVRKAMARAARKAGIQPVPPSGLRHFYASRLAEDGLSLTAIQQRLRHARATTTDRYLHEIRGV